MRAVVKQAMQIAAPKKKAAPRGAIQNWVREQFKHYPEQTWSGLRQRGTERGYANSAVSSALTVLLREGRISKPRPGFYVVQEEAA